MAGYGLLIREARERKGWTQAELCERLGVSTSTLSHWENEVRPPEIDYINDLIVALSISPETLLSAMGINMTPPMVARLPRPLLLELLARSPEDLDALLVLLRGSRGPARPQEEMPQ